VDVRTWQSVVAVALVLVILALLRKRPAPLLGDLQLMVDLKRPGRRPSLPSPRQ
jgi:hypothetical protein